MRGSVVVLLLSAACAHESVRGSGRTTRELRDLPRFEAVAVHSGIHALVETGPQAPVQVDADDNILPLVVTEVVHLAVTQWSSVWPTLTSKLRSGTNVNQIWAERRSRAHYSVHVSHPWRFRIARHFIPSSRT